MPESQELLEQLSPVNDSAGEPQPGSALCLSGGGYRAMIFHLGVLWRLNDLGYLPKLDRISSVSGGSITAGVLGLHWSLLDFGADGVARGFGKAVVDPVRSLAGDTIDVASVLGGVLGPGTVPGKVRAAYRKHLFGDTTLQDLPDRPRFVINATNVQSKSLWRFSKPYMRDYRVGEVRNPTVSLATAVCASSAFPPFLSPVELDLDPLSFTPASGDGLQIEPYISKAILTDGGVYDNLGLETAWKRYRTILVSDAGGALAPEPEPHHDWARHSYRILNLIDSQVRALRVRQVIGAYKAGLRDGAYWSMRSNAADFSAAGTLPCPVEKTLALAATPTRLKAMDPDLQERIINWGYAACDAAMRTYVSLGAAPPAGFPYPQTGL